MIVDLSEAEMTVLCMELEHSPDCVWSGPVAVHFVVEENGEYPKGCWVDEACTIPYVEPECTCGYFALLYGAQDKLRQARVP